MPLNLGFSNSGCRHDLRRVRDANKHPLPLRWCLCSWLALFAFLQTVDSTEGVIQPRRKGGPFINPHTAS